MGLQIEFRVKMASDRTTLLTFLASIYVPVAFVTVSHHISRVSTTIYCEQEVDYRLVIHGNELDPRPMARDSHEHAGQHQPSSLGLKVVHRDLSATRPYYNHTSNSSWSFRFKERYS